jgi:hypothetical protein
MYLPPQPTPVPVPVPVPEPVPNVRIVFDVWCLTYECTTISQNMDVIRAEVDALRNDLQQAIARIEQQDEVRGAFWTSAIRDRSTHITTLSFANCMC